MSKRWQSRRLGIALELSAVLTLIAGVAVLLKIAGVARGRLDFAFALVSASDFSQILLSTLLGMAPTLALTTTIAVMTFTVPQIYAVVINIEKRDIAKGLRAIALLAIAVVVSSVFQTPSGNVALLVITVTYPVVLVLILATKPRIRALLDRKSGERNLPQVRTLDRVGSAGIALGLFLFLYAGGNVALGTLMPSDEVWAPAEVLYFDDREPYVARVLSNDDEWTHVVIDDPREIRVLANEHLLVRQMCTFDVDAEEAETKLWLANVSERVSLYVPQCDEVLEEFEETFGRNQPGQ